MLAAVYRGMLNMGYGADKIDFTAAANCKAHTKRLIELVNEHRNMAPVPRKNQMFKVSSTVPFLDLGFFLSVC